MGRRISPSSLQGATLLKKKQGGVTVLKTSRTILLCGAAVFALGATAAAAEETKFNIPAQPLSVALKAFSEQSGRPVLYRPEIAAEKVSGGATGTVEAETALGQILAGSNLTYRREGNTFLIVQAGESGSGPQSASAGDVDALIVTAQKKEENIQDVPIAISAFSAKALDEQKIEGGFDLLKAIPNVTFSKNNFSSYNFSIRGIGTKAVSVATDPGVAVSFNNTSLIRNRLFEQEYYDIERVEVLRGPQGTLYGRNATAGVINVISAKPDLDAFDGQVKVEVGNYSTRRGSGYINLPIVEDKLALRVAGAFTERDGYDYNSITEHAINGRELYSTRVTLGFEPTERLRGNFIWEHFEEDDNRSRTGKQLCRHDPGLEQVGTYTITDPVVRATLSQGCLPVSLYDDAAFGTPNGLSIPFMLLGAGATPGFTFFFGYRGEYGAADNLIVDPLDPYRGMEQSRDLRTVASAIDPIYRAAADIFELNFDFDVSDNITLSSQTLYNEDEYYSSQDYNRFNSYPVVRDTGGLMMDVYDWDTGTTSWVRSPWADAAPGGIFCDPQLGCSDTIFGMDISRAKTKQFSQEFRLASSFDGPLNFNIGANYTRYETVEDYFVLFNLVTAIAEALNYQGSAQQAEYDTPYGECKYGFFTVGGIGVIPHGPPGSNGCVYVDPNPLGSINGEGHNYFRSQNPYELSSTGVFGELYWEFSDTAKLTAGLRYTDDKKTFTRIPSQVLLSTAYMLGGTIDRGYPVEGVIKQHWGEFTGRIGVDWTPELSFTDRTMFYGFYSRGYKGGGANPPGIGFNKEPYEILGSPFDVQLYTPNYSATFEPEFINAFEIGAKNTLLGGSMILNLGAFYYDYKDYQVSRIVDRTAVNENFDATVWGLELESVWHATPNLRINLALGFQDSSIADGEKSIDLMNRTQGADGYAVIKPWVQLPSNCVVTIEALQKSFDEWFGRPDPGLVQLCPGSYMFDLGSLFPGIRDTFPNGGQGFYDDLSGNELPNTPHWTQSVGAQYTMPFGDGWRATVRGDFYHQSQSYHRVYNSEPYDKLRGWTNANLSLWVERPEDDLKVEVYVKNLFDDTPITDAFLNSDDTSLTTNVFTLDPRLIGFSITKGF